MEVGLKASPAFQFYPQDWLVGTAMMTFEEKGVYMTLLCYQWTNFGIPNDVEKLNLLLCGKSQLFELIKHKFKLFKDGLWKNEKMEQIREKMINFNKKQRENGMKSVEKRKKSQQGELIDLNQKSSQTPAKLEPDSSQTEAKDKPDASQKPTLHSSSSSSSSNKTHDEKPPVKELIAGWCSSYEKTHGRKYIVQSTRDIPAIKRILRSGMSVPDILGVAEAAWKLNGKHDFERSKSEQLVTFVSDFNRIAAAIDASKVVTTKPGFGYAEKEVRSGFRRPS